MSSWSHWFWVTTFLYGYFLIQHIQADSLQVEPVEQDEESLQNFGGKLSKSTEKSMGEVWRRARGGFPVTIPTNSLGPGEGVSVSHSVSRVSVRMGHVRAVRPSGQVKQKTVHPKGTKPNKSNKKGALQIEKRPKHNEIQADKILLYRSEDIVEEPVILDIKIIEDHIPVKVDNQKETQKNTMHVPIVAVQQDKKQQLDISLSHSNSVEDEGSEEEQDDGEITSRHDKIQRLSSERQLSLETLEKLKSLARVSTAEKEENPPIKETESEDDSSREGKAIRPSLIKIIQVNPEDIVILPEGRRPSHHDRAPERKDYIGSQEIKEGIDARKMFPAGEPLRPMKEDNDQSPALSLLNQRAHFKQMAEQKNMIDADHEVETDDGANHSIMDMIKAWTDSVQTTKSQIRKYDNSEQELDQDISIHQLNNAERNDTANNTEHELIAETVQMFSSPLAGRNERIDKNVKQFIEELKKSIENNNKIGKRPKEEDNRMPFSGTGRSMPDVSVWNHGFMRQGAQKSLLSDFKPQILNPREFTSDSTLDLETRGFGRELYYGDYYTQDLDTKDFGDYIQDLDTRDFIQDLDTRDFINDLDTSPSEVHYMAPLEDLESIEKSEFIMEVEGEAVKTRLMDVTNIVALTLGTIVFVISVSVGAGVMFYRRQYYLKPESLEDTYSHSDCASCNYTDTQVFQTVSYGDCVGIDIAKENLTEDLNTLDNDSFLNSLEVMAMPEYWNDSVRL